VKLKSLHPHQSCSHGKIFPTSAKP